MMLSKSCVRFGRFYEEKHMNVGLLDVDSHRYPNLPLMKLSAYHKNNGDNVEMLLPLKHYDKIYVTV